MTKGLADRHWHSIADRLRENYSGQSLGQKICNLADELLDAAGTSLALVVNHAYSPISSSNDLAAMLDEEQFALGNGPTFDAQNAEAPVSAIHLGATRLDHRWPAFSQIAHKHEIHAVFAFPLRIGSAYLGVMSCYRKTMGELNAAQFSDGLILASIATAELVRHQAGDSSAGNLEVFEAGLYDQSSLQLAAGMVAESLNCSILDALLRIRARAFADDRPVSEIARQIVSRELELKR